MSFTNPSVTLSGLCKIILPARTLYICDSGMVMWGSETYLDQDSEFGGIGGFALQADGVGEIAPGGMISFVPVSGVAATTLSSPSYQGSKIKIWVAEVSDATGLVVGTPQLLFDGLLRMTTIRSNRASRRVELEFSSTADRLLQRNRGNVCSDRFHQSIWPGEEGMANATGAATTRAFGIDAPARGTVIGGGSSGGSRIDEQRRVFFA
jgi:hypothetical protein